MRFAIDIPNFGPFADPAFTVALARDAESAGWDAIWVWDHILRDPSQTIEFADPWILLTAIACATTRVRIGPMVVALPRRRPWLVAREAVTLDHVSGGRLTLGLGLGSPPAEFSHFGEQADLRVRAGEMDEGLDIIAGLWSGQTFEHHGRHFDLQPMVFAPRPLQQPRIPIWLAATWPIKAPLRRAARWDGVWPLTRDAAGATASPAPSDVRELVAVVGEQRRAEDRDGAFDVLISGYTPGDDPGEAAAMAAEYADAGATWWTERINDRRGPLDERLERVRKGPPRR